jgi:hypothetical protein
VQALANQEVGDFLTKYFVSVYDKVGTFQVDVGADGKPRRNGGNVAAFFCTPSGYVIHVAAGPRTAEAFLAEAKWAAAVYRKIMTDRSLGQSLARVEQVSRVTAALREAHSDALDLMNHPNMSAPGRELVLHDPPQDPNLRALDDAGRKQRKQVHHLMMTRAYEPLANVGPWIYSTVLGEQVTSQPVQLTGAPEAKQGARTGQSLLEFYNEGGAASVAAPAQDSGSTTPAKSARMAKASKKSKRR